MVPTKPVTTHDIAVTVLRKPVTTSDKNVTDIMSVTGLCRSAFVGIFVITSS